MSKLYRLHKQYSPISTKSHCPICLYASVLPTVHIKRKAPAFPRWRGSVTRANISIHIANNKVTLVRRSVKFDNLGVRHSVSLCRSYTDCTNNIAQFRQSLIVLFVCMHRHYQLYILKGKLQLSLFPPLARVCDPCQHIYTYSQ